MSGSGEMSRRTFRRVQHIVLTTDPVKKGNRTYQFTEEQLKELAETFVNVPMRCEHRGKPFGVWEKAWYLDGKLWAEGVIFEPETEREREIIRRIDNGELKGLSPSITFKREPEPKRKKVVFHGNVEVIGKDQEGRPIVRYFIPKEEIIAKVGSIENFKKLTFDKAWLHDGSEESKRDVEADYTKE